MSETRLNAYRIMWLFVFFDLPTNTKTERRHAAQFRKALVFSKQRRIFNGTTGRDFKYYTKRPIK